MKQGINRAGLSASGVKTPLWAAVIVAYIVISLVCKPVEGADVTAPDMYEPDDTASQATMIEVNGTPWHNFHKPGDTASQATMIEVNGTPQKHNFHKPDDVDYVKFYAVKGEIYEIIAKAIINTCYPKITVYNLDGVTEITPHKANYHVFGASFIDQNFNEDGILIGFEFFRVLKLIGHKVDIPLTIKELIRTEKLQLCGWSYN
ncbi:MAG: hypothetical protein HQL03_06545, partial [Nitrospirae bacterium]|nr:hypothetical protein [Nitrospirota bacterium]